MRRLFFRITLTILITVVTLTLQASPIYGQQVNAPSTVQSLIITMFSDGSGDIQLRVAADPDAPRVTVSLIGNEYDNILVTVSEGRPLDYSLNGTSLVIDSLGETDIAVTYTVKDLATASGALWSITLDSPISSTLILPKGADIISVSQVPIDIATNASTIAVLLPAGHNEISYVQTCAQCENDATSTSPGTGLVRTTSGSLPGQVSLPTGQLGNESFSLAAISIAVIVVAVAGIVIAVRRHASSRRK